MNLESINKWLDNEYGVSYTRLEELHDFLIEQNMKYQDKIEELQQENKQLKKRYETLKQEHIDTINRNEEKQQRIDKANELLNKIVVREREDGNWGAVKNTSKQDVYKTIWKLYEILDTSSYERNEMLKILGGNDETIN